MLLYASIPRPQVASKEFAVGLMSGLFPASGRPQEPHRSVAV